LRQAKEWLFQGEQVVVDANFREEAQRCSFLETGIEWGVPAILFVCEVSDATARQRLQDRKGDISDADWGMRQQLAAEWEPLGPLSSRFAVHLSTELPADWVLGQALSSLEMLALAGPR